MLDTRLEKLLTFVVETYVDTAEPVGSRFLAVKKDLGVREATIRNDLRALEELGYLTHPHTSAGRVPTTAGYEYYLTKLDWDKFNPTKKEIAALEMAFAKTSDYEMARKYLAKELVELAGLAVIAAFSNQKVYYTGLSNLFSQPDFTQLRLVADISQVFDRCDEYLPKFCETVARSPKYFLGHTHPFGEMMSALSARFGEGEESMIILLGPQRMNYKKNWGLMKKVLELI